MSVRGDIEVQEEIKKLLLSFFAQYSKKSFSKGETVIKLKNKEVFFLIYGTVRMSTTTKGTELTLNIYRPYSIFPMSSVLGSKDSKYIFNAMEPVEGYFAPKKEFEVYIKNNPGILYDLLRRIYLGLDGYYLILESLLLGNGYLRILTQLVIYARRFSGKNKDKIVFDFHLTHQQLASQTGLARESVTRELKKLQSQGLIGYSGKKLFIFDRNKLEESLIENLSLDNSRKL